MILATVKTIAFRCLFFGLLVQINGKTLPNTPNSVEVQPSVASEEAQAYQFISELNTKLEVLNTAQVEASWNFNTNITNENEASLVS